MLLVGAAADDDEVSELLVPKVEATEPDGAEMEETADEELLAAADEVLDVAGASVGEAVSVAVLTGEVKLAGLEGCWGVVTLVLS